MRARAPVLRYVLQTQTTWAAVLHLVCHRHGESQVGASNQRTTLCIEPGGLGRELNGKANPPSADPFKTERMQAGH